MRAVMPKHPVVSVSERIVENLLNLYQQHRQAVPLSKNEAAGRSGISPQTVGYVENRERHPSLGISVQMFLGMGRRPSQFFAEAEELSGVDAFLNGCSGSEN